MPHLAGYLDDLNIEVYVSAPIVSDAAWKKYYSAMSVFKGNFRSSPGQVVGAPSVPVTVGFCPVYDSYVFRRKSFLPGVFFDTFDKRP
ncbi:hypothetical protein J3R82DRAFT_1731 [Butyriboletus roseoflavus]|nr:hypothetical protein J3R82DRAFT_1731 [Butyriboletus roseoflavus]